MKDKAINSFSLNKRIEHNEKNQRIDINKWAFKLISKDTRPLNILELCCGTGRQSEYLINHYINSSIDLLDISQESLNHIKNSSYFQKSKISTFNIDMDEFFLNNKKKYDIIFVSYGLYYSKNIDEVLKKIKNSINQKGQFIVMGPHGNNNKEIFEIIESTGLKIDKKIKFTCTDFMYDKVINYLSRENALNHLDGFKLWGADMNGTSVSNIVPLKSRTALIMGSESHGYDNFWNSYVQKVTIPRGEGSHTESLNVAVATSILLAFLRS